MSPTCIMIRNRPQSADIIEIVKKYKRAFVGYPPVFPGCWGETNNFKSVMFDISNFENESDWKAFRKNYDASNPPYGLRQTTTYRNMLHDLEKDKSIIVVPRPSEGKIYLGIFSGFELVEDPCWGDKYLELREKHGLPVDDRASHLRDIVQSFCVKEWKSVSLALMPAWLMRTLFGRSTVARFKDLNSHGLESSAYEKLKELHDNPKALNKKKHDSTLQALLSHFRPEALEHLVVALMQYKEPNLRWLHVGGSGDGGVDGIGFDDDGKTRTLIQCKWQWNGKDVGLEPTANVNIITAYLLGPVTPPSEGRIYLDGQAIAELVEKYKSKLPQAYAMGL